MTGLNNPTRLRARSTTARAQPLRHNARQEATDRRCSTAINPKTPACEQKVGIAAVLPAEAELERSRCGRAEAGGGWD
ncbi:hypothetical protein SRHO_G00070190 [Serrasalmus rhombeus]